MRKDRSFHGFLLVVLLAGLFGRDATVMAGVLSGNEICDAKADYSLGVEDYPETAKLHRLLVAAHPNDALAHYHLGFAYGMLGRHGEGLAYERYGRLAEARQEMLISLRLDPNQAEARNMLAVIYAEDGNYVLARQVWSDLAGIGFEPASTNLAILDHADGSAGIGLSRGA